MKRIGYSVILSIILLTLAFAPVLADTPTPAPTATATTYPTPTTVPTPSASFKVNTSGITVLVAPDGSKYTVSNGTVTLPTNQIWYAGLIANGTLSLGTQTATTFTATTVNATTLKIASVAFTGAIKYGRTLAVTDGMTITHGMGATPSSCTITPEYTGTFTQSVYIGSFDSTVITVSLKGTGAVSTLTAVDWFCGK